MASAMVKRVNEIRQAGNLPYSTITRQIGLPESTFRRWNHREKRHITVLAVPGPKKTAPLNMGALMQGMETFKPCRYRIAGAPALWNVHSSAISRRDFYNILDRYMARLREEERLGWWRYRWLKVGVVWAMDDMDFGQDETGEKLRTHNVMDVGSRHMFEPLDGSSLLAEAVALNLEILFILHGAPLFIKSDNGANLLRSEAVSAVLSRWSVLPILSPPWYPQYNGVIERSQSDERKAFAGLLGGRATCPREHFRVYAIAAVGKCNHICRTVLDDEHACHVFSTRNGEMKRTIQERRKIYDWIKAKQESILSSSVNEDRDGWAVNAAWRSAAEEWLLQNKVIEIIPGTEKVSTHFGDNERS